MADLEYAVADGIGTIRLNRPERKNAFTLAMADEWAGVLADARTDPDVRVLILTGTGDAFCSGVDLDRRNEGQPATALARKQVLSDRVHRIALAMEDLDKPVIAARHGPLRPGRRGLHPGRAGTRRRRLLLPAPAGRRGQGP
jgi:enoyl-CoA hydratase/carnithine racemase